MSWNSAHRAGLVAGKLPGLRLFVHVFYFPTAGITSVGHHTSSMASWDPNSGLHACKASVDKLSQLPIHLLPSSFPLPTLPSSPSLALITLSIFMNSLKLSNVTQKITSFKSRDLIKKEFSLLFLRSSIISTIFTVWRLWVHYCQSLIYLGRFSQKSWWIALWIS